MADHHEKHKFTLSINTSTSYGLELARDAKFDMETRRAQKFNLEIVQQRKSRTIAKTYKDNLGENNGLL